MDFFIFFLNKFDDMTGTITPLDMSIPPEKLVESHSFIDVWSQIFYDQLPEDCRFATMYPLDQETKQLYYDLDLIRVKYKNSMRDAIQLRVAELDAEIANAIAHGIDPTPLEEEKLAVMQVIDNPAIDAATNLDELILTWNEDLLKTPWFEVDANLVVGNEGLDITTSIISNINPRVAYNYYSLVNLRNPATNGFVSFRLYALRQQKVENFFQKGLNTVDIYLLNQKLASFEFDTEKDPIELSITYRQPLLPAT